MAAAHEVHQRDVRDDQNVTVLIRFFLIEGNKKILIHREKSRFPFTATAHRDFEISKKAVLDFCCVQSLAEAKGLGTRFPFCIAQDAKWTESDNN